MSEPTRDALFAGELVLWQPARGKGYRFNLDPALLAHFAPRAAHVLDLGAGCGVLGLSLLFLGKAERVTAVEIQSDLAELAGKNAEENGFQDRFEILRGDLRDTTLPMADAVVFNPPYFRAGAGRIPPESGRHIARHEAHGTLVDFVDSAVERTEGSIAAIVPHDRFDETCELFVARRAGIARCREVLPRENTAAGHVLIEARHGATRRADEPPLIVHGEEGRAFSPEVRELLESERQN